MDEPWVSGRAGVCDGPALEPTADRVATYMSVVARAHPALKIGLIEAYPFSSAPAIESMVQLLRARGVTPASCTWTSTGTICKPEISPAT